LNVCWGLRGRARRVWVNDNASSDQDPLLIDSEIESWHCEKDAELLLNAAKPGVEILTHFKDFDAEINEHGSSGERVLSWEHDGLKFEQRVFAKGKYLHGTLVVRRREAKGSSQVADHISAVRRNIDNLGERPRKGCVQVLWRYLYSNLVTGVAALPPAFVLAAVISAATGREFLVLPVFVAGVIVAGYAYTVWMGRQNRKYLNKMWFRLFHQGDYDGTVPMALASIGVELPAAPPT